MVRTALLWFSFTGTTFAASADSHIAAMDGKANAPTDTWFRFTAVTQEPGKAPREMTVEVQNQGEKRLVNFEGPSDMKGTRVLVLSRQQMWVYLPAYRKVRRVASHVKQQGFMGTTYSDEDMSTTSHPFVKQKWCDTMYFLAQDHDMEKTTDAALMLTRMAVRAHVRITCSRGGSFAKDWWDRAGGIR